MRRIFPQQKIIRKIFDLQTLTIGQGKRRIAEIYSNHSVITDTNSATDRVISVLFAKSINRVAINKAALGEDFFDLSTCLAGEVLQKFVNYNIKFAVY